ncbi:MAG: hypothetical protein JG777_1282 [Clostridia bacterium]|jgi:hypothetical protein|uniref:hypothetical protein n=1 Tax=Petroclostridium xylanilyticum TaxID=1792311 RepID=UPI000B995D86|nr:hypothetical protein [Petroclostridium xylanilyticum]MBZ4645793.1 hypothetical protein [Clostridia bacterium]
MSFVGLIDRIENGNAYIVMENGMFEIAIPVRLLKNTNYKEGDLVTVNIRNDGTSSEVNIS